MTLTESSRNPLDPLYKLDLRQLSFQAMDLDTVLFLIEEGQLQLFKVEDCTDHYHPISWSYINNFLPEQSWFSNPAHFESIHGIRHLLRATLYAAVLAQLEGYDEQETQVACISAGIHDLERINDRDDPEHGLRSGLWFFNNVQAFSNRGVSLSDSDVKEIVAICTYHEYNYDDIPGDVKESYGRSLDIVKHADLLDRYRLPTMRWWPKQQFIRLESVHKLLDLAKYVTLQSELYAMSGYDNSDAIQKAALEVGLLIENYA
ncbi:hypothetical protein COW99_00660 [Candidatus Roizmanbacteria bacterium CG22_combo_CG10-13_8_21_14_all_38_20]|uniref:HD/PDEase domain-containing protein n=1 Tax=Candidatus Roizmanbacteria bacterium CG22_combo_CG10-13_8_21_14_all_38_20 TaxID=1974862 RepID=A0A2H0BX49_9BACT|nr:hypothetical protein [Candidatus Microgenomates bacterium]PIP62181.1 MAG: hypothetical protein COW99_00660 [Candidatus Roizmanbacteria bacterium CG22_combo_CG10-13_8_21_14_all_38_20]PJC30881.1 MAG: hypothetical protein CO050_04925 [Candidatus Roizmanbacteria bacterium CG_4_9_14_0_2_um_filter_38_17]